jgi:thymidylate synthase ThyX
MYNCEILADSLSPRNERLTTFKLTYPRIVHAEFMTHRAFSRNSASSRAIPFVKMVESVEKNPFIPIAWQKSHKGMQGTEYLDKVPHGGSSDEDFATDMWLEARDAAVEHATHLNNIDVTKQLCNRLLEPFMYHTVICTATEWENFFSLRCPAYLQQYYATPESLEISNAFFRSKKDFTEHSKKYNLWFPEKEDSLDWYKINESQAEIHIQALAEAMWDAMNESTPKVLEAGEFHLPFIEIEEDLEITK